MESIRIVLFCVVTAVAYGILHDQITARICVEYFTIGHPPVFPTADPTLLGIGWGIIATWWVGVLLGIPLAIAARLGKRPKRSLASLMRPIFKLLAVMGSLAFLAGLIMYIAASSGWVYLLPPLADQIPASQHVGFLIDAAAHNVSYLVGFLGGIVVIWKTWRSRQVLPLTHGERT